MFASKSPLCAECLDADATHTVRPVFDTESPLPVCIECAFDYSASGYDTDEIPA
jgi:hypothetical protein